MSINLPQGQPLPAPASKARAVPNSSRRTALVGGGLVALAVLGFIAWRVWGMDSRTEAPVALFEVERGPLTISVSESGAIQNRDLVVVKSEVEGKASLLSVVAEGTNVEKGQLLAELDSSSLVDQKTQQTITVMNAEAAFIGAQESLAVTESQTQSDIDNAQLAALFAEMDLKKYEDGDFPQNVRQAEADITIAKEDLQRANDQLEWSKKLEEEKFITRIELQADELAAHKADLNLQLAQAKLSLLKDYQHKRDVEQLKSNVTQTKAALDRVKRKATADIVQAKATLKAREAEYNRQKDRLAKIDQQITKCKIFAPVAGMVVYATTGKNNFRGDNPPLAEGQDVRERQELIYLPTTGSMMADVKVHESSLRKIRKDLPVRITVETMPGKVFMGRVGKIALLPDAQSIWLNPDLKLYETEIYIDGDAEGLRAGMTCKAEIIVARYDDAVNVPVQSVVRVKGRPTVYLPGTKEPKPREVEIGLDNNQRVHIIKGLEAGEKVLLAPPLGPSSAPISDEPIPAKTDKAAPAAPAAKGAGGEFATPPADASAAKAALPPGFDAAKFRAMSGDEKRKFMEGLTPEQQDAVRKLMPRRPRPADDKGGATAPPAGAP